MLILQVRPPEFVVNKSLGHFQILPRLFRNDWGPEAREAASAPMHTELYGGRVHRSCWRFQMCTDRCTLTYTHARANPVRNRKRGCASPSSDVWSSQFELGCLPGFCKFRVEVRDHGGCLTPGSCPPPPPTHTRSPGDVHLSSVADLIPLHSAPSRSPTCWSLSI